MKKGVIFFTAILLCVSGMARDLGTYWVVSGVGRIDCKRINLGINKARVVLTNGQKAAIHYNDISSYSADGKVFVKLRLYEDNKATNKLAFMEQIKTWNNLGLYKLPVLNLESINSRNVTYRYYL
jgi:hypothetical protein